MKIFILTSRFPYPTEKGDKLRIYHQIRELSQRHQIFLCSLTEFPIESQYRQELEQYCEQLLIFNISKRQIISGLLAAIFSGLPFQVAYFKNASIARQIDQAIEAAQPDWLFAQLIRTSEYLRKRNEKKYIDYMDAFSEIARKMADKAPWYSKWLWRWEFRKLQAYETAIYQDFDRHSLISPRDLKQMEIPQGEVGIIPNGVDYEFFSAKKSIHRNYELVFVGNMGYTPNVDAVQFIVKSIMPLVWEKRPTCKLLIAGARPSAEVQALEGPNVSVSGWIEDIRDAYGSAKIFLAPIFLGAGQQNKILEAMSSGLPCLTTENVNLGIGGKADENLVIAQTAVDFAEKVDQLLKNEQLRTEIAENAKSFVRTNFSWSNNVEKIEQLIQPT
ncbi:MAG: glycosyltransferase [Bacteroidota bacterium]